MQKRHFTCIAGMEKEPAELVFPKNLRSWKNKLINQTFYKIGYFNGILWKILSEILKFPLNILRTRRNMCILFLELGVGYNTPGIIKYPFWQMTAENGKATYACLNMGEAVCPDEIKKQSVCIDGDIGEIVKKLLQEHGRKAADVVKC